MVKRIKSYLKQFFKIIAEILHIKYGWTRIVFRFFNYVIKIPNFIHSETSFSNGCYCNYSEHINWTKNKNIWKFSKVAESLYCSPFGLFQIQRYCEPLLRDLTNEELDYFSDVRGNETKKENFGIYNGKIVCVDYPKVKEY